MNAHIQFQRKIKEIIKDIDPQVFEYNKEEYWMVQSPYEYIEFYATDNQLQNTMIALKLARGLHNGVHRKSSMLRNGVSYRLPYLIHPLLVTRMLVDLHIPISHEEEDILLASSLCHDMIEDIDFLDGGKELYTKYHLDPRVYETVKYVSKSKDFTEEQEKAFFHEIETHELALFIKLSDRGHNVEDLYNMKVWKVHEYVEETKKYFLPMCEYALKNYPEHVQTFEILKDKLVTLTHIAEILVDRYSLQEKKLQEEIDQLRKENEELRKKWKSFWEE